MGIRTTLSMLDYSLVLVLFKEVTAITLADQQITLTMHAYGVSWNRALATCSHHGGTLYTDDSPERRTVLTSFSQTWPNHHLWVGLHYPPSESNSNYGWTDCLSQNLDTFDNWKEGHPEDPNLGRCVFSDKNTGEWKSKPCQDNSRFVCQYKGGPCTFTVGTGRPSLSGDFESANMTATDLDGCFRLCLNKIYNLMNCWAVNYEYSMCTLFFTTDPFLFHTHQMVTYSASFHMKSCYYNNGTISIKDSSITATDTSDPNSDCVTFDPQTTPFPFVPTTTTETTALPISSATSTTAALSSFTTTSTTSQTTTSRILTTSSAITTSPVLTTVSFNSSITRVTTTQISTPISRTTGTSLALTSTSSTTTHASSTLCQCSCINLTRKTSNKTLSEKLESIHSRLQIDTRSLSSSIRKKTSAKDDRTSSQTIGLVALSMILFEIFLVLIADFLTAVKFLLAKLK